MLRSGPTGSRLEARTSADILVLDSIGSTNAEARRRAEAGEAGPLWIAARRQTEGRGRRGRAWETAGGNLAATLLLTTDKPPAEAAQLAFVAALAAADLAQAYVPPGLVTLKWPNDVLVAGRKVSGILIESGPQPDGRLWLAVGIGANLASPPRAADRPATSLAEHLRVEFTAPPSFDTALQRLTEAFDQRLAAWRDFGFDPIRTAWLRRAHGLGRPCVARLDRETVEGVAEGLEPDGALALRLGDGSLRRITAGDVFFPEPAEPVSAGAA